MSYYGGGQSNPGIPPGGNYGPINFGVGYTQPMGPPQGILVGNAPQPQYFNPAGGMYGPGPQALFPAIQGAMQRYGMPAGGGQSVNPAQLAQIMQSRMAAPAIGGYGDPRGGSPPGGIFGAGGDQEAAYQARARAMAGQQGRPAQPGNYGRVAGQRGGSFNPFNQFRQQAQDYLSSGSNPFASMFQRSPRIGGQR